VEVKHRAAPHICSSGGSMAAIPKGYNVSPSCARLSVSLSLYPDPNTMLASMASSIHQLSTWSGLPFLCTAYSLKFTNTTEFFLMIPSAGLAIIPVARWRKYCSPSLGTWIDGQLSLNIIVPELKFCFFSSTYKWKRKCSVCQTYLFLNFIGS
jgi:hypothetical protein